MLHKRIKTLTGRRPCRSRSRSDRAWRACPSDWLRLFLPPLRKKRRSAGIIRSSWLAWLADIPHGGKPGENPSWDSQPQVHRLSFGSCFLEGVRGEGFTPQEIAASQPRQTLAGAVASLVCSAAQSWGWAGGCCSTMAAFTPILP